MPHDHRRLLLAGVHGGAPAAGPRALRCAGGQHREDAERLAGDRVRAPALRGDAGGDTVGEARGRGQVPRAPESDDDVHARVSGGRVERLSGAEPVARSGWREAGTRQRRAAAAAAAGGLRASRALHPACAEALVRPPGAAAAAAAARRLRVHRRPTAQFLQPSLARATARALHVARAQRPVRAAQRAGHQPRLRVPQQRAGGLELPAAAGAAAATAATAGAAAAAAATAAAAAGADKDLHSDQFRHAAAAAHRSGAADARGGARAQPPSARPGRARRGAARARAYDGGRQA
mmetsp:Transcript_41014/g.101619  ORF Transcript_41014/g.101619 Transcript_41014/m.101619 type:complete len:292 (-) Transcript_41014:829-1704(-)